MARQLKNGQGSRVLVVPVDGGPPRTVLEHPGPDAVEAPNWTADGASLIVNAGGVLHRLSADGSGGLERIAEGSPTDLNNDHVLDPDGARVHVSSGDGHLYTAPLAGGPAVRVTADAQRPAYLHGVSPDGRRLAYVGVDSGPDGGRRARILVMPAAGGAPTVLTEGPEDDGPDFAPDGSRIWFNSSGEIHRIAPDGSARETVVADDCVNWFPHPSPDGRRLLYLAYPPGTEGHPADLDVRLRLLDLDDPAAEPRDVLELFGGQGTINVPGWAPDSSAFACVAYTR